MANRSQRECSACKPALHAYLEVSGNWERELSLIANLLIQISVPNDGLTPDDAGQLGETLKDFLHRLDIARHYFFDVEIDVGDEALVAGTLEFIKRRSNDHFRTGTLAAAGDDDSENDGDA